MIFNYISAEEALSISKRYSLTMEDRFRLARYPYLSLSEYCNNISPSERDDVQNIEDINIWHFLKFTRLIFGIGDSDEVQEIRKMMQQEPLRQAALVANLEQDPKEKESAYFQTAILIMLSIGKEGTTLNNPINVKIYGRMPQKFLAMRQRTADDWFKAFVGYKLRYMRSVYRSLGHEEAFAFLLHSTACSIYKFDPLRYNLEGCKNEDEVVHRILHDFIFGIQQNPLYKRNLK